nr:uncharacterized protein LOC131795917 [Pocillopora verrucosa]
MAEDKVLESKEELGLKSESSSDIEKCQVVFKKESDVAGHKSTVTKEAKVEAADGKQDHLDQSSSDEEKGEDLSAGKVKESEIGSSTGTDKSDATSSDNGVDFNASLSVSSFEKIKDLAIGSSATTSEGKDSANQEKVNLEDELLSGQFGFKKESDDDDGKSTVSQQASSTAAVGSLDFADKGLSDESEATPVEKKVDMKDAPLVDQEKSQVLSSGKSKDLDIGSSTGTSDDKVKAIQEKLDLDDKLSSDHFTSKKESVDDGGKPKVGKEDNMAADENLAAADNSSLVITETQVEAAEGDENFPFNNSSGATKSEATSSDNGVGFKASLSVADTSEGKDSANQEKVNLEDELSSDQEKSQVLFSGKSKDLEIESSTGKDSANQEKVNLEDELLSGLSGFKKESDDDDGKSTVGQQASSTAAVGSLDFADNSLSGTSEDKVKAIQEKLDLDDKLSSDHFTSKKESDDDGNKPKVGKEDNMEADENLAAADNGSPGEEKTNKTSDDKDVDLDNDPLVVRAKDCFQQGNKEYRQGDFHRALQLYTEGLQLNCKDNRLTARLYNNRAAAHFRLENFENSLDDATVAVQLEPTFIKALEKGAEACVQLKLYDEAKIWCHKGLAMDDNSKRLRHLLNKCGSETIASGEIKPQQVKEVEIAKDLGDKTGEGRSYGNLGNAYLGNLGNAYDGLGQFKTAIDYHKRRLEIAKEVGDKDGIAQALCSLATNFERHECLQTALDYYISSREIFNNVRASFLLHHNWKISYRNVHKTAYNGVWRVLLLKGEHVKALLAAEEGRAQALRDIVDLKYSFRQTLTWSNSRKCSDCLSLRNVSSDVVFLAITGPYIALWTIRNGEVVQSRIKHVNNFLYQRELEVYITSLNKAASLQVSARAAVEWQKSSTQVGRDEKGTSDGSPRNATTNALRKLYDIIVAPIADLIDGDELVFVPEGPLCLVPYAALVDSNSRYLCESFRIRVIPSLTILKSISDCPTELHNKTGALLVGDPCYKQVLYQGDLLNQLPGARKEVKMIGGILGIAPLVGGEATKEEVFRRISSVALVHIAAHGKKETGEILLAPNTSRTTCQAEEEDYLLTMRDVLRAGLRAKLVVLSCCHSACGEVMAEGVVGIARAFLGAGARSVLVSLWAIDDDGTQEFMKHFYGALEEGKGTSEAVNQAMKCMRESETFSKGYYWAPFVLIGDDVKLELTEIKRSSLMDLFEDKRRPQAFGTD